MIVALKFFLVLILSSLIPQIIKIVLSKAKKDSKNLLDVLSETGGMPSSHSSLMFSITTLILLTEGFDALFFLSFALTMIVIRDAVGVRYAVGIQGKTINSIIDNLHLQENKKNQKRFNKVDLINGHTIPEVTVGSIIGVAIAIIIYFL